MISKHITYKEATLSQTASRLGLKNDPDDTQLAAMKLIAEKVFEPVRAFINKPIIVSSFFRSPMVNIRVGGSGTSQHCKGEAMDLTMPNKIGNRKIYEFIRDNLVFDQLIYEFGTDQEPAWVHVSYKEKGNRRQILRAKKVNGKTTYESFF
jgi:zinc D-Ala-D-Ala carboxypeptidase